MFDERDCDKSRSTVNQNGCCTKNQGMSESHRSNREAVNVYSYI